MKRIMYRIVLEYCDLGNWILARQCVNAHGDTFNAFLRRYSNCRLIPSSILTRFDSSKLFSVYKTRVVNKRALFRRTIGLYWALKNYLTKLFLQRVWKSVSVLYNKIKVLWKETMWINSFIFEFVFLFNVVLELFRHSVYLRWLFFNSYKLVVLALIKYYKK